MSGDIQTLHPYAFMAETGETLLFRSILLFTKYRALQCVSSLTYCISSCFYASRCLLIPSSGSATPNYGSFTTHHMFMRTYKLSVKNCSFLTNTPLST